ncbi:hypothetical protein [Dyadobacter diqingensis]|uniref:hypothetical protein n=1 Tax=Dyadobacter diqingensis TaxID=2938121 RepID=UPI0020C1BF98|nr:hypothetical protein [Dyadobacter diqingensis]
MKITAQILARYSDGTATSEEIWAVTLWLASEETESAASVFPDPESKEKVRLEIEYVLDRHIALYQRKERRDLKTTFAWYAAAACLVIGFWINGFYQNSKPFSEENITSYDNLLGENSKSFTTSSGLVFTLAPHSKVLANTNYSEQTSSIHFCGAMEITNRSGRDMKVVFSSDCKKSNNAKQIITCKEGKSYVALQHNMQKEEIIVVNRNRISDLPGQVVI